MITIYKQLAKDLQTEKEKYEKSGELSFSYLFSFLEELIKRLVIQEVSITDLIQKNLSLSIMTESLLHEVQKENLYSFSHIRALVETLEANKCIDHNILVSKIEEAEELWKKHMKEEGLITDKQGE